MKAPFAGLVIKVITLLSMVSLLGAQKTKAQTVTSFNFSAASQPVSGWINVTGDPSLGVRTATDPATGITISSVATANWSQFNSICAYDGLGATGGSFFPSAIMLNHWFNYDGTLANYQPGKPQFQLTGLDIGTLYTIRMAGSTTSSLNANPTRYTVAGNVVYAYSDANNHSNTLNGATFNNVAPDASGTIKIYVNTITTTDVADISGLQISPALKWGDGLTDNGSSINVGGYIYNSEWYLNFLRRSDSTLYGGFNNFAGVNMFSTSHNDLAQVTVRTGSGFELEHSSFASYLSTSNFGGVDIFGSASYIPGESGLSLTVTDSLRNGTGIQIYSTGVDFNTPLIQFLNFPNNASGDSVLTTDATGHMKLKSISSFSAGQWKSLGTDVYDSLDNIGIGTSNTHGYKLAVNGTGIFTQIKVKPFASWPDYVFKKGYDLPDLAKLERYIAVHKHLPGIASESDIQRDGVDIGDNQAALLKKVEELTIYLIDENKKLKEQNARLEQQQQEIDELKKLIRKRK